MPVYATDRQRARVEQVISQANLPTGRNLTPVDAYVNHGRWVADCPCNGGELVTPGVDMVCGSCGMSSSVKFPTVTKRGEIDGLLEKRPVFNQNWRGEDLVEVLGENIAYGIERPAPSGPGR